MKGEGGSRRGAGRKRTEGGGKEARLDAEAVR